MYGRQKMTALLRRQGHEVFERRAGRRMRELGVNGLVRGKGVRATVPDRTAARVPDLLAVLPGDVDRAATALAVV
ncbi:hypothetical protein E4A41_00265 [Micrococcus endophyticus]|uniref:Transposase InsO family protein n=1 Tax=Micrococcus endophyticus TaxID=455343 RepID=A0A4Y8ZN79_9MICC|nr:transposase InsO family protein [Micrococcus endophyticus]TFI50680.1 hypothetical protein E4A41_00265 [Micrococcus endophyticus]